MIAALKSNDTTLMSFLSIIYVSNDSKVIDKFLHHENADADTILKIVIAQGSDLSIHCKLLIKMEQDFHRVNLDHSLDQCLRKNIGPHKITEKSITWENDFIHPKTCWKTFLIILNFASLHQIVSI